MLIPIKAKFSNCQALKIEKCGYDTNCKKTVSIKKINIASNVAIFKLLAINLP